MNVYKSMYLLLFNGVTDALRLMSKDPGQAELVLKAAQQKCEEMYMDTDEDTQ